MLQQSSPKQNGDNVQELRLLEAVAEGDRLAFERLYIIYHRRLSRLLSRFFDRYGLVEEIINDTLLVVWEQAHRFERRSKVSTWIMGIAYRRMLKSYKRFDRMRRRDQEYAATQYLDGDNADALLAQSNDYSDRDWLRKAMTTLVPELRLVLEFAYYCGYSCEEIATITAAPVGTVKTRMLKARQQLRYTLPRMAEPQTKTFYGGGRHEF
jgi:RNA polymerase sigma-70 factor (ECF subfamily)